MIVLQLLLYCLLFTAMVKVHTDMPDAVALSSGSLVRLPTNMALFIHPHSFPNQLSFLTMI